MDPGEKKVRKRILIAQDEALYRQLLCLRLALASEDEVFPILDHQQSIFDRTILNLPEEKSYRDFIKDEITGILEIYLPAVELSVGRMIMESKSQVIPLRKSIKYITENSKSWQNQKLFHTQKMNFM